MIYGGCHQWVRVLIALLMLIKSAAFATPCETELQVLTKQVQSISHQQEMMPSHMSCHGEDASGQAMTLVSQDLVAEQHVPHCCGDDSCTMHFSGFLPAPSSLATAPFDGLSLHPSKLPVDLLDQPISNPFRPPIA